MMRFFIGKDRCLKLKNGGFFTTFCPTHPRSLSVYFDKLQVVVVGVWTDGGGWPALTTSGSVVVAGRGVDLWRWLAGTDVASADEGGGGGPIVGMLWPWWFVHFDLFTVIYFR